MSLTRIFHHQATANAKESESLGVFVKIAWLLSTTMRPRDFEQKHPNLQALSRSSDQVPLGSAFLGYLPQVLTNSLRLMVNIC